MNGLRQNMAVDLIPAGFSFCAGTTVEHGLSVGKFRENTGLYWAGALPG